MMFYIVKICQVRMCFFDCKIKFVCCCQGCSGIEYIVFVDYGQEDIGLDIFILVVQVEVDIKCCVCWFGVYIFDVYISLWVEVIGDDLVIFDVGGQ